MLGKIVKSVQCLLSMYEYLSLISRTNIIQSRGGINLKSQHSGDRQIPGALWSVNLDYLGEVTI